MIKNKNKRTRHPRLRKVFLISFIIVILLCVIETIRSNTYIDVENITFRNSDIPDSFDGVKIVQISDYHNQGEHYADRLIKKISEQKPDYIFITGDIIDSSRTNIDKADYLFKGISEIAPCYMVWGNHEPRITDEKIASLIKSIEDNGIDILENEFEYITRGNDKIMLTGMNGAMYKAVTDIYPDEDVFSIWLHHFPEDIKVITDISSCSHVKADLIFSGHAHGGLIRFPFKNGLYAPGQGMLPEYTSGEYEYNGTHMIVSRGLGNSGYSLRFMDPFHLVVCTLENE